MASRSRNAPAKPTTGDSAPGTMMLCQTPLHCTPWSPDWAIAAPISPPKSAWEELDGSPARHVIRFQAIAPKSAASRVCCVTRDVSMIP